MKSNLSLVSVDRGPVDYDTLTGFTGFFRGEDKERVIAEQVAKEESILSQNISNFEAQSAKVVTYRRHIALEKLESLSQIIIDEVKSGKYWKVIIFAINRDTIETLRQRLSKIGVVTMYNGTPEAKAARKLAKFKSNDKYRAFVVSVAAAHKLDLNCSNEIVFIEPSWKVLENIDAIKRCECGDATKTMNVRFISTDQEVDQTINKTLIEKCKEYL